MCSWLRQKESKCGLVLLTERKKERKKERKGTYQRRLYLPTLPNGCSCAYVMMLTSMENLVLKDVK